MTAMGQIEAVPAKALFGDIIVRLIARHCQPGPSLAGRLHGSALALLSSGMIIEDPFLPFQPLAPVNVRTPLADHPVCHAIDALLLAARRDGLVPHFARLVSLLGALLLANTATEAQLAAVDRWVGQGLTGGFLMTDGGGSRLDLWRSQVVTEGDRHRLTVDKVWIMFAEQLGFASVVVRTAGSMTPAAYLLPPEACERLSRRAQGAPFLDGTLPLGALSGEVEATADDRLSRGGALAVSRFLCQARPRLILGVIAHVQWLAGRGVIAGERPEVADLGTLAGAAQSILAAREFTRHSIDEVLALKFAFNETLLALVAAERGLSLATQRDLLAFTKMEGSSFQCFSEIHARAKGQRHG